MQKLKASFFISCFLILTACGGSEDVATTAEKDPDVEVPVDPVVPPEPEPVTESAPSLLVGYAFSGTSIGLTWRGEEMTYYVYRGNTKIGETNNQYYVDQNLSINTQYTYSVTTGDVNDATQTVTIIANTLVNETNDGLHNGAETVIANDRLINFPACNITSNRDTALNVSNDNLDTCLQAMLSFNNMAGHLEDMRAFAARVRSEQPPAMVELGTRLFHSKTLSANEDTACSSCHHPVLGCGGDNLSMPIGLGAQDPSVLGLGRVDPNNSRPTVPRNSPQTCNTALWSRGLFWDNRVALQGRGLTTESSDVTNNTIAAVGDNNTLTLLMAQAHFPVTAATEMGDITEFGYDENDLSQHTQYRENEIVNHFSSEAWQELFTAAYGDSVINFSRIAEALAAYQSVQLFINNPFFDYVDGDINAIDNDDKRGAITFMASSTGCTFCHAGAFFTTEAPLPANYPQIGIGKNADGSDSGAEGATPSAGDAPNPDSIGNFRAPSLLNVALTGPWGHAGQFGTLKRNVEHYQSHGDSITRYFADEEMCALEQFKDIPNCAEVVAPDGLVHSMAILEGNAELSNNISDAEVDLVVKFLATLTDPDAANTQSNAMQILIPPRDGGLDGKQLDAQDKDGNPL
ncbi:cytochrome-c peroxidase [Shewanella surugensis]|uniref:Cytochrome c domain-containing protein n=1 Tax=Shewanella surugensis TaxID=212020 RepID=A0ABT0LHH1_9GAMM|nr:cytochrome c peroxidase [Shewanella surugensis]MCL1127115.1 hypothetical protein [Shewanella surugensis]